MPSKSRPQWRLPPGVTRGLWEYAHSDAVAYDYDEYFAHNQLFEFDEAIVLEELLRRKIIERAVVADLGCGTGRAARHARSTRLPRLGDRFVAQDVGRRA